jgi:hypothetical protein
MSQPYPNRGYRQTRPPARRRRRAGFRLALIAIAAAGAFVAGFILLWALGSWMVGGPGFPGGPDGGQGPGGLAADEGTDYDVTPLVDLLALRDLAYVPVKGVHVTSYAASSEKYVTRLLDLADTTEINALVIDIKDDTGHIAYESDVPIAQELELASDVIEDVDGLLATLAEHNIIPIARIVCFKDDVLTKKRPDLAIQSKLGGLWADRAGHYYLNPYNHEVWDYLVQVAEEAAQRGFREIQFDYVRFPTDGDLEYAEYPGLYCLKEDAIAGFLAYARPRLEKLGVWVSADVYGLTVRATNDGGFGQKLEKICQNVDVVCPMVYPSHYSSGSYGAENPNSEPDTIISGAMNDAAERFPGTGAKCRPYLQDFYDYTAADVRTEIDACEERGFDEWILWDPNIWYTEDALHAE